MDQELRLTIGGAARAVGVSAKAVRLWEAKGLVTALERTDAGYRLFTTADVAVLRFICQAKALGLTLTEIKDILDRQDAGTEPCERVVQLINAHIAEIDRSLADLQQLRHTLLAARSRVKQSRRVGPAPAVCRIIEGNVANKSLL